MTGSTAGPAHKAMDIKHKASVSEDVEKPESQSWGENAKMM